MTVYVDQGNANNDFQITDTYNYDALVNNFGITVQTVGAYARVRVKNITADTASFSVDTVLCPIVEAVPRSLSEEGNLKVAIHEDTATISTLNSTTNIGAGVTWSGDFETITNQSAIQFALLYDQYTTIYVDQGLDTTTAMLTDTFYGEPNVGLAHSIASIAPYYRIRVKNQNAGTQATGSITSAKTAILNILPRTLSHSGALRIASPVDEYGWSAENTKQGETRTVTPTRLIGAQMDYSANAGAPDPN